MTRDERIEAVVLAIAGKDRELEDVARSAILATLQSLREPSKEMKKVASAYLSPTGYPDDGYEADAEIVFEYMINAAIKEMTDD